MEIIMKKKVLTSVFIGILCILMVGCNKFVGGNTDQIKKNSDAKFDENGVELSFPDKWKSSQEENIDMYRNDSIGNIVGQIVISYISDETIDKANKINTEADKISERDKGATKKAEDDLHNLLNEFEELCTIVTIDSSIREDNAKKELFSKYKHKDLIGKKDKYKFYLLYNDSSDTNYLSEKSQKDYKEFYGEIKNFKSLIHIYKPVPYIEKISKKATEFNTRTLDGKKIDSSILKDSKLTMVNIWATFCEPCIKEMPDIQQLYEEVKNNKVNIIGIISDTPHTENEELAKKILATKGVEYINIIPDDNLINNLFKDISAVPTTMFIDSKGNIIGDLIVGSRSKEEYKKEIQDRLKSMNYRR